MWKKELSFFKKIYCIKTRIRTVKKLRTLLIPPGNLCILIGVGVVLPLNVPIPLSLPVPLARLLVLEFGVDGPEPDGADDFEFGLVHIIIPGIGGGGLGATTARVGGGRTCGAIPWD